MKHPARRLLAAAALAAILVSGVALAEGEPTRAEYVAQLEGICKPDAEATQRAVKGVKGDIRAERLTLAAAKFAKAGQIFAGTVHEISVVPRPPADAAKLAKWFTYLGQEEHYLAKIAAALHAGHTIQSQRYTARFVHNGNLANNTVLAFGFDYCSFKISRFG
jgi:flagella basal body P-ring formation protein FlgA